MPVDEICRKAGFAQEAAATAAPVLTTFLTLFGVVAVDDRQAVKAKSRTASLLARSLAEHLDESRSLLDNWSRTAMTDAPYAEQEILAGPLFLYLLERRRLARDGNALPLEQAKVAQVLVSRRQGGDAPAFLLLYDATARRFQLPGGHIRADDPSPHEAAVRELEEEIPDFRFDPQRDRLEMLGTVTVTEVSRSNGVVTGYEMTFFHLRTTRTRLDGGPQAQWAPAQILLTADAHVAGRRLNTAGLRLLNPTVPGSLAGLPPSFVAARRGWITTTAKTKPLEFWGLVIGIVGVLISVVFFLLS
ncbi:NUDIX domain-containing protein [Micromonospora chokoriensis]|uniref:NUDIX domain-containing protein n=1 Tax=Micromonospora chokoriensis TaxID=356851 RepID=A0A1C4XAW7_9ACTN|nr:NUDIX domain-containing protein [Micromonospora chokoriensis]SCF05525.1 NUDIX domain-containing protein [Micromonospora chokoriensis]